MAQMTDKEFEQRCQELSRKLLELCLGEPKQVIIVVFPSICAAISEALKIDPKAFYDIFRSALEDMQ